jgi:hypothetical protein
MLLEIIFLEMASVYWSPGALSFIMTAHFLNTVYENRLPEHDLPTFRAVMTTKLSLLWAMVISYGR